MANYKQLLPALLILLALIQPYMFAEYSVDNFLGVKYQFRRGINYNNFLEALGVRFPTRVEILASFPMLSLTKYDGEYTFTSDSAFKIIVEKFRPEKMFEYKTVDGRSVRAVITILGNILHEVQEEASGRKTTIDFNFSHREVRAVYSLGDINATTIYSIHHFVTKDGKIQS